MPINQFVSSTALKLFLGIVLVAVMIISIFNLSQDLHVYLSKLENGDLLQIGSFGFLLLLSTLSLYFLFKKSNAPADSILPLDFKILGMNFLNGFIDGLTKVHKQN